MKFECVVCGWIYDEEVEGVAFADQPEDYVCPLCGAGKEDFQQLED